MTGARREAGKRTEISPICSLSAFSEIADTIGWLRARGRGGE